MPCFATFPLFLMSSHSNIAAAIPDPNRPTNVVINSTEVHPIAACSDTHKPARSGCRQAQGLKKPSDRRYCTRTRRRRPGSWAGVARGRRRGGEGPHLLPLQRRPGCRVGLETPPNSRQSLYWRNGIVCGSVELLLGAISKAHATAIRTDPGGFGYSRKLCLINVGRIPHRTRLAAARALSGIRCCSD